MTEEDRFMTIREFFESVLDEQDIQVFRFSFDGQCYASNSKGRNARVSIALPKTIVDKNLKDLYKFNFFGIAIPIKEKKEEKKDDGNNIGGN